MTREEKGQIIDELAVKFSQHNHFYITDASGFSVEQIKSRFGSSATSLLAAPDGRQNAERNWFILFGSELPES